MEKPVEKQHGPFTIKAGVLAGKAVARAFVTGGKPGVVAEAQGDSVDAAVATLIADLDARSADQVAHRRHDPALDFNVPTEAEYAQALAVERPHDSHWKMLRAHALAGETGLTTRELAFDAGYHNHSAANLQYGTLAKHLAEKIGCGYPKEDDGVETDVAIGVLATIGPRRSNGEWVWVMHPELRAAVLAHTP